MKKIAILMKKIIWDLFAGIPAVALVCYGIWRIHRPSAFICLGLILGFFYVIHELKTVRSK